MTASERRQHILECLMQTGSASVESLAQDLAVSRMTVHRDLHQLAAEGLLRKVHGGASMATDSQFESSYHYRKLHGVEIKRALACTASQRVRSGQSVLIDGGSTAGAMVEFLLDKRPLTVVTAHADVIMQLMQVSGITLIALGGLYDRHAHMFHGLPAEQALRSLRVDWAFLSTSAVHGAAAYHPNQSLVQLKRACLASAERSHLLLEHDKFDRTALFHLADLSAFDSLITDRPPSASACQALADAGVRLELATGSTSE